MECGSVEFHAPPILVYNHAMQLRIMVKELYGYR
jgi:hypothetical protein